MQTRPSFSVATLTVLLLSALGVGLKAASRYVPIQTTEAQQIDGGDYARLTEGEWFKWHALGEEAFAEAKRTERPIMLVMGAAWQHDARVMDELVFSDPDVQTTLARSYVCVRVDLDRNPAWIGAVAPLSRVERQISPGFQIAFLDSNGSIFESLGRDAPVATDPRMFISTLNAVLAAYRAVGPFEPEQTQSAQEARQIVGSSESGLPNLDEVLAALADAADPRGGFRGTRVRRLNPFIWSFMLSGGQMDGLATSLDPVLRSSIVDWLDGGFFRRTRDERQSVVDFDKSTVLNAEMALLLARRELITGDSFSGTLAKRTFQALQTDLHRTGFFATARIGDEDLRGRSARTSFSAAEVQSLFGGSVLNSQDSAWAAANLGLDPAANAGMAVRVVDAKVLGTPNFDRILGILRRAKQGVRRKYTTSPRADVNGLALARMAACARLWGGESTAWVKSAYLALMDFVDAGDVRHLRETGLADSPYLGDYTAVSQAALQHYLLTGDTASLELGLNVFQRARELFDPDNSGLWRPTPGDDSLQGVPMANMPELLDNFGPSTVSQAIQLGLTYGRLLSSDPVLSRSLIAQATGAAARYGSLTLRLGVYDGSMLLSLLQVVDTSYAVAVGPKAVEQANQLLCRVPTRLIAPALGRVRPDLQKRGPGLYVITDRDTLGPMSVDQAAALLPVRLGRSGS